MNIVQATTTCMKKYITFSGRAKRSEYWWFYLFTTLVGIGYNLVGQETFLEGNMLALVSGDLTTVITIVIISYIPFLVFISPILAAGSRRLHDIGKSGWWQLLWFTGIGGILLIVWWAFDTKPEGDKYGEAVAETA